MKKAILKLSMVVTVAAAVFTFGGTTTVTVQAEEPTFKAYILPEQH
ncbi:hypothetical protein [Metabacillus iocasae]|uniref:Uncharacterized protein n=1 Tax=Priestia iocasae TaxID=2291674 RepID=A0ABS2QUE9_9BACI|nr:hypothetical protein [Metabacillus iocasae]MBM7703105.1 hypothetical protein [Metabacillus iocasae]